jgi:hypothetical protein
VHSGEENWNFCNRLIVSTIEIVKHEGNGSSEKLVGRMSTLGIINNDIASYKQLIDLYHSNKNSFFGKIDLQLNGFFAANMSAALGGVLDLFAENLNEIRLTIINSSTEQILLKNDFLSYFGYTRIPDTNHTTIRYQKLTPTDGKYFNSYVVNELIERNELPKMSEVVKEKMAEKIYEIFVNAQMHSDSKNIYTCGQFYPNKDKIEFTIVDVGIGFKRRINERFNSRLSSVQAIKWATVDRNTTKESMTGGIGLALLKEFITLNNGKMQIVSDDGFYEYSGQGELEFIFDKAFPGTIVNLQFRTDDNSSYIHRSEITVNDLF